MMPCDGKYQPSNKSYNTSWQFLMNRRFPKTSGKRWKKWMANCQDIGCFHFVFYSTRFPPGKLNLIYAATIMQSRQFFLKNPNAPVAICDTCLIHTHVIIRKTFFETVTYSMRLMIFFFHSIWKRWRVEQNFGKQRRSYLAQCYYFATKLVILSSNIFKNIHWEGLNEPPKPTLVVFGTAFSHAIGALSSVSALKSNPVFAPEMCAR